MSAAAAKGQTEAMSRFVATFLLLSSLLVPAAQAETRAWLDRDVIQAGETATLNVETDQPGVAAPDWSPLEAGFEVSGHTSSRRVEMVNGDTRVRSLFAVALRPRREGAIEVPALRVGQESTAPLELTVRAADDPPAQAGAVAFIEAELDSPDAWVQQAVGYVLRLYYATPLVSGELEQPQPEGATLQRVGDDLQYSRDIGGRRYSVVERRFLLIPDRSGPLDIPAARFRGRGTGSFFDDLIGGGPRELRASGEPQRLQVRPMPDGAPRPWLPLRGLEARFLEVPHSARAGEAVDVVVELRADGATAAQIPAPELRADGAQAFAEPADAAGYFERGRPQVVVTRRFSLVPRGADSVQVELEPLQWWDARAGAARTLALPPLLITVGDGAAAAAPGGRPSIAEGDGDGSWMRVPGVQGEVRPWAVAAVAFALLWLATLAWGLHRRPKEATAKPVADRARDALDPGRAGLRRLRHALDTGDLGEVEQALCALPDPSAAGLDGLRPRLADPAQAAAVDSLQRARWAGGDPAAARAGVREAFARGPRWHDGKRTRDAPAPVPQLYPERQGD